MSGLVLVGFAIYVDRCGWGCEVGRWTVKYRGIGKARLDVGTGKTQRLESSTLQI